MRSSVLLLVGFGMVAGGVALAVGVDGGVLPGVALAVLGLCVKAAGFLLGDPAATSERGPQTLAGRRVERPRAGIPVGRATVRRRVPRSAPAAVVRPLSDAGRSDVARPGAAPHPDAGRPDAGRPAAPRPASPAPAPNSRHRRAS